ncbi:hypothetical protein [Candidatus Marithrix sp. Canyon 246]|nr:hypothetical protein [Candidatus Marithrix sp. Canyon 246]
MNSKIILESIDSMSDEELQAKYESHKHGSVGRVFIEAKEFLPFFMNQSVEEHIAQVNDLSIYFDLNQPIKTNTKSIGKWKIFPVTNDNVYMLAV